MFRIHTSGDGADGYAFLTAQEVAPCGFALGEAPQAVRGLAPTSVRASTFIAARDRRYPPELAFDGDPATAWNEAAHGHGRGEWIEASFDTLTEFQRVTVSTGWDHVSGHGEDLFLGNAHLRRVKLQVDGHTVARLDVAEDDREVTFEHLHAVGSTVRLVAEAVWPGARWSDLCIAEVAVEGVPRPAAVPSAATTPSARAETGGADENDAGRCLYQTYTSFHLRPTETVTRAGSEEVGSNPEVRVLRASSTLRGGDGIFYVRLLDGSEREGWMFIPLRDLGPGCPQI